MRSPLEDAYSVLRDVTPLKYNLDCGKLCGNRCCHGTENDGMELFHGEEKYFENEKGFTVRSDGDRKIVICSGKCDRKIRPLSCRMYPFFPVPVEENGKIGIKVVYDIRGLSSCPVVREHLRPDPKFLRAVRMAGLYLIRDKKNLEILKNTASLFEELISFSEAVK